MRKNLLLIDGHNFLFKAYGMPFKFKSKNGTPLHVATAFLSLIRRSVVATKKYGGCQCVAVVFDTDSKSSNQELSPVYKANRKQDYSQDEDSPFHHLDTIKRSLKYLKIEVFEEQNIEADDLIASLAVQFNNRYPKQRVFIASQDSDFYQLISAKINQIHLQPKGKNVLLDRKAVKEKVGVYPRQYVRYKMLTGDPSDNIKGVPNIGKIRAAKVINKEYEINLEPHKKLLEINGLLIKLDTTLKIKTNWSKLHFKHNLLETKNNDLFRGMGL